MPAQRRAVPGRTALEMASPGECRGALGYANLGALFAQYPTTPFVVVVVVIQS